MVFLHVYGAPWQIGRASAFSPPAERWLCLDTTRDELFACSESCSSSFPTAGRVRSTWPSASCSCLQRCFFRRGHSPPWVGHLCPRASWHMHSARLHYCHLEESLAAGLPGGDSGGACGCLGSWCPAGKSGLALLHGQPSFCCQLNSCYLLWRRCAFSCPTSSLALPWDAFVSMVWVAG